MRHKQCVILCIYTNATTNQKPRPDIFGMFAVTRPSLKLFFVVIINNDIGNDRQVTSNVERRERTGFPSTPKWT